MESASLRESLNSALKALRAAEDEMNRPDEDVVTPCSCHFTRLALNGFLRAFLAGHRTMPEILSDSDELLALCSSIDPQFESVNLSSFVCRIREGEPSNDDLFCLSVDKVSDCLRTTREVRDMVLQKLKLRESDFAY